MSQPKRFDCDGGGMFASKDGEWVDWDDYAALAAENERLQGNLAGRDAMIMARDSIIKCRDEEIKGLKEEIDNLELYGRRDK